MGWAMLWLFVALKIPILTLGYIVWWAVHQTDEEPTVGTGDDGGSKIRPHPRERLPRPPRRGPHGDAAPLPPPRVRHVTARARELER